jgi:tetratricopeptide (TPR) repeat protein
MPSLKNLDAFASLFRTIGGEEATLKKRGLEPDVLMLPDREPEPLPSGNIAAASVPPDEERQEGEAAPEDMGLDELLGDLAAMPDLATDPMPDAASGADLFPDADVPALEEKNEKEEKPVPPSVDDVLGGGAELGGGTGKSDGGAGITPDFDFGDFAHPVDEDLSPLSIDNALPIDDGFSVDDDLPADLPIDGALPEEFDGKAAEEDDTSFSPDSFNLDGFDDPFGDMPQDIAETPPGEVSELTGLDDFLQPDGAATSEPPEQVDEAGPTVPDEDFAVPPDAAPAEGDLALPDDLAVPENSDDPFDRFDLAGSGRNAAKEPEESNEFPGLSDFVIPGIDVPPEPSRADAASPATAEETGKKSDDINLTEEEFAKLQETLQDYPLNLRIACQESILNAEAAQAQLSQLVKLLVRGGAARDAAKLVGKIQGQEVVIPRGYQKQTGEELEAEQASFAYIFAKKFLPTLSLILFIAGVIAGMLYLGWNFIYKPWKADSVYKIGIERIAAGEYERANERFNEAWRWKPVKDWFYTYAEAFRDARQYFYAEEKYEQLIAYTASRNKSGVPEKKAVLDYALMETDSLRDYEKADRIIRNHILDWNPDDADGLIALGDVNLNWGDANVEFSNEDDQNRDGGKYEMARQHYARHLELYGWTDPVLERMLLYFIRADDLAEILPLQDYFMSHTNLKIRPSTLSETGAYFLDKQTEETRYVRDANIEKIEGVRDILLRAAEADPLLPDPHYQLARYYAMLGERNREREYLDNASRLFDNTRQESAKLIRARIDTEQRMAHVNRDRREFFSAEERRVKAASLYEDAVDRRIFRPSSRFGNIYADLGDLEYFTKFSDDSRRGNWQEAITYYLRAEESGYSTTEMQYRLGASYYNLSDFRRAEERFFEVSTRTQPNRRVLNALGNVSFLRGNLSAAESCFSKLVTTLEAERLRITDFRADDMPEHRDLAERIMIAQNNLGAVYQTLAERSGNSRYRTRALALYSDASRAWDYFARDPETFIRPGLSDFSLPTVGLPYLNTGNILYPASDTNAEIFMNIDRDMPEPSPWETLLSNN